LGVGSLILIPLEDFPTAFLVFIWGVRLAAAFYLPVRVFEALALAPADGSLIDSPLGGPVETGMTEIGMSPSNLGRGEIKLSKACIQTNKGALSGLIGFPSRILDNTIFPTWVDLFLQGNDSVDQPMGGYTNSGQTTLFQGVNFVSHGSDMREFERCGFFSPSPLKFRESAYKGREAWFMVLIVEPHFVPSLKRGFHGKFKKADTRAGLKTHTPNNLLVSGTCLIF
jgi:hypothetical protein